MPLYPTRDLDLRDSHPVLAAKVEAAFKAFVDALNEATEAKMKVEYDISANTYTSVRDGHGIRNYTGDIAVYARVPV